MGVIRSQPGPFWATLGVQLPGVLTPHSRSMSAPQVIMAIQRVVGHLNGWMRTIPSPILTWDGAVWACTKSPPKRQSGIALGHAL